MTPDVSPAQTRVLLALIAVYERDGRATITEVAEQAGRSRSTVFAALRALRKAGFVDWPPGAGGGLRPVVSRMPVRVG